MSTDEILHLKPYGVRAIRFSLEDLFVFTAILILLAYSCAIPGEPSQLDLGVLRHIVALRASRKSFALAAV